ncbi:MAG: preprotein translocase subunit SecA [Anaerolineales bacterium]
MLSNVLKRLLGDPNARELSRMRSAAEEINALEPEMQAMSNDALREQTQRFREQVQGVTAALAGEIQTLQEELDREPDDDERRRLRQEIAALKNEQDRAEREALDAILPRAFAAAREAAVRTIGLRPFDEQLIGGMVLHRNMIAEMKTGEGKTLVAVLPLYLAALTGRGAHLVTPNDYLSKYGVQWMGPVYHLLGLSVAVIQSQGQDPRLSSFLYDPDYAAADDRYHHLRPCTRAEAYRADITYGTNHEFGFDYLRDNMVQDISQCVQRELYYAIVDEVDNILIDEARTPLIISGESTESADYYRVFAGIVGRLVEGDDYTVDEKRTSVTITDQGITKVERALGIDNLYDEANYQLTPYLENALKAKALFARDRDYVVNESGEVIIVDAFTGRLMYGRRYSEGLHQAIEAKEGVRVQRESLTLATITFQNYFRMYRRLAGMTGTAETEAEEFRTIYGLDVMVIPTHKPVIRVDLPDLVYKTAEAKYRAALKEIEERHAKGQPVLVGTLAIETSEMLSARLKRMRIPHEVLNAKQHEHEAQVIAQAGQPGAVTIATNMAGRGVDILLGGNPEGLARDKLRRQGVDLETVSPEVWQATLAECEAQCLADREKVLAAGGLHVLGTERYEARRIDNQLRGRAGRQGDPGSSRFYVSLEDDLMKRFGGPTVASLMDRLGADEDVPIEHNMVTKAISNAQVRVEGYNFDMRKHLLEYDDVVNQQRQVIYDQRRLILTENNLRPIVWDILVERIGALVAQYTQGYEEDWALAELHQQADRMVHLPAGHRVEAWQGLSAEEITDDIIAAAEATYDARERELTPELMRQVERQLMLRAIDRHWVTHLTDLDELREGIGLRAVGQRDPLVEYKREAFDAFNGLLEQIESEIASMVLNVRLVRQEQRPAPRPNSGQAEASEAVHRSKVGRNAPCPCGSGKKYKQCCLLEGLSPEEALAKGVKEGRIKHGAPVRG